MSAESNIPTFRGPQGCWRNHDPTRLATAKAIQRDPTHRAIAELSRLSGDHLVVTQNVLPNLVARARRVPPAGG